MSKLTAALSLAAFSFAVACGPTSNVSPGGPCAGRAGPGPCTDDAGTVADAGPDAGLSPTVSCSPAPVADAGLVQALVAGNNQLAVQLFGQLSAAVDGGNLFFSPFSISAALGMTYAGSAGTTQQQMAQVLQFPADPTDLAPAFGALDCQLEANAAGPDGGQLDIADELFGQVGFTFAPAFLSLLQTGYGAPLQTVDFTNLDAAAQTIDAWVSQHTDGMIPNVLQPGDLPASTLFALANALYFDGLWQVPFNPQATANATFNLTSLSSAQVPMMTMQEEASMFPYLAGNGFAIAELPYQSQVAMDILLPDAVDGLPALTAQLTAANLEAWLGSLKPTLLEVTLPKFNLDSRPTIVPALQSLGLTVPFLAGQADFSGIDGSNDLYISTIIHEAVLQVDEGGTRAAAVTIVGGTGAAAPQPSMTFDVNHPFLLLLRDTSTGSLLFMGQVTNPAN